MSGDWRIDAMVAPIMVLIAASGFRPYFELWWGRTGLFVAPVVAGVAVPLMALGLLKAGHPVAVVVSSAAMAAACVAYSFLATRKKPSA